MKWTQNVCTFCIQNTFKCWNYSRIVIQSQFTQLKQHFFTFLVNCPHTFRLHLSDFKSLGMKSRLYARYWHTYHNCCNKAAVWRVVVYWHQVTLIFSSLWRNVFVVTGAKLMHMLKKLSDRGSVHKSQNSVLKAYVSWKLVVTNAWTFRENILFSYKKCYFEQKVAK